MPLPKARFYNTIGLQGIEKKRAEGKALTQRDVILIWFHENPGAKAQAEELNQWVTELKKSPLTSVRRACCDLCDEGSLEVCTGKRKGLYQFNTQVYRVPAGQGELF